MKPMVRDEVYCFLSEAVSTPEDQNWSPRSYTVDAMNVGNTGIGILSVHYNGVMQTFGDVNYNKRIYEGENVLEAFMRDPHAQKKYRLNKLTGELGHPMAENNNEELSFARLNEVPKERAAMIIRNLRLEGNRMLADIQTDPGTENFGVNVAKNIIAAGYVPSHSLRSFGSIRPGTGHMDCKGIVDVKKFITYDMVESPSHVEADAMFSANAKRPEMSYHKVFEGATVDPNGSVMIPYESLAEYALKESQQEYLMEAFQLDKDSVFGVTSSGKSVVLKERSNLFYVPVTEQIHREIGDVLLQGMKRNGLL